MSRHFRLLAALLAVLLPLAVLPALGAVGTASAATRPRVKLVMRTPDGVPAQVRLAGPAKRTVTKNAAGTRKVKTLAVRPGRYRVAAPRTVSAGVLYRPVLSRKRFTARGGTVTRVVVRWKRVAAPAKLAVTGTTADSVRLTWRSGSGTRFLLRRSSGERAPKSPTAGTRLLKGTAGSFDDAGLRAGRRYSYSLFVRKAGKWVGPVSSTAGTVAPDPVTGATAPSYAVASNGVIVDAGDVERPVVRNGQVWVTLAAARPAPVIGAGVALPISRALPGGYLGKVAEIAGDGRTVRLRPGALTDLFSAYDLSTDAGTPAQEVGTNTRVRGIDMKPRARSARAASRSCLGYSTDLELGVDPSFGASGHFETHVHSTWYVPHAVSVSMSTRLTMGAAIDIKARKALECELGLNDFVMNVVTVPVPMAVQYSAGLKVAVDGEVTAENIGYTATVGFDADTRIGTSPSLRTDFDYDGQQLEPTGHGRIGGSFAVGGEFTFGPGQGTKGAGVIAGVGGDVEVAKLAVDGVFGDPELGEDKCLRLSMGGSAKLRLHAEAWLGGLEASKDVRLYDRDWAYADPFHLPAGCDGPELGTGEVQATLRWDNSDDMDLHVVDPGGEHIYYSQKTSISGGQLDYDVIPGCSGAESGNNNVENIYWPENGAPSGTYEVYANEYSSCTDSNDVWTLEVRVGGRLVLRETGSGTSEAFTFEVP